jgi:hypothetical protein
MLVSVRLEIVLILTQDRCMVLYRMYHRLRNCFGCTWWNSEVTGLKWNIIFSLFGDSVVSAQDRYTVCAKHTISSEIILDALDGTVRTLMSPRGG